MIDFRDFAPVLLLWISLLGPLGLGGVGLVKFKRHV
jgi:hypothetical protein